MKKFFIYFRPFVLAPFILYIFDKMAVGIDIFIPINVLTVLIVGLFEIPGLIMLIVLNIIFF